MSLFDSRAAPKWQHTNPQVREEAIALLSDEEILLGLVRSDPAPAVQAAALSRITSGDSLDALIETVAGDLQQQARVQRLQQLLPNPDQITAIEDDDTLLRIASLTDSESLAAAAIARIKSTEVRVNAATHHPLAKVRLKAAWGIDDIGLLHQLMLAARDHDRGVYRHCKQRLDEHHARQQAETEKQERILHLGRAINALAGADYAPDYAGQCQGLTLQWKIIEPAANPKQRAAVEADLALCADRMARATASRAAEQQAEAGKALAHAELAAVVHEMEQMDSAAGTPLDESGLKQLNESLDELEQRWQAAKLVTRALPGQVAVFTTIMQRWRSM
ncbi:MAG: hypothetical protein ACREO9_11610, partial [Lysobacterales bacterium]